MGTKLLTMAARFPPVESSRDGMEYQYQYGCIIISIFISIIYLYYYYYY